MKRVLWVVIFLAVAAFGIAVLHYVNAFDIEHHRQWAKEKGLPEPAESMFWIGSVAAVVGAFVAGLVSGRRRAAA
jgi:hypothetical protein